MQRQSAKEYDLEGILQLQRRVVSRGDIRYLSPEAAHLIQREVPMLVDEVERLRAECRERETLKT